jgi:hypothetical protein
MEYGISPYEFLRLKVDSRNDICIWTLRSYTGYICSCSLGDTIYDLILQGTDFCTKGFTLDLKPPVSTVQIQM